MKLDKIKGQLQKIKSLIDSLGHNGEGISQLERDLLLDHIRKMYDYALAAPEAKKKKKKPKIEKVKKKEKDVVEEQAPQEEIVAQVPESQPEVVADEIQNDATPETVEEMPSPAFHIPEEVTNLFNFKKAVELSEKLSESPIEDLTKAMGINEKIFTIKELFGGEKQFFDETLAHLNDIAGFEEAKDYLIQNVAVPQNWGDENKQKKASHFIKLVRRRYK